MTGTRNHILTFDEQRAAEAAFRGLPIDSTWSPSAQAIYAGILMHTLGRNIVEEATQETLVLVGGEPTTSEEYYTSLA